jgi:tetratricopeptide (TPR) repeat protein
MKRSAKQHSPSLGSAKRQITGDQLLCRIVKARVSSLAHEAINVVLSNGGNLGEIVADALEENPNPALAYSLHSQIPAQTSALRRLALLLMQQIDTYFSEFGDKVNWGRFYNDFANRLADSGDLSKALVMHNKALEVNDKARAHGTSQNLEADQALFLNNVAATFNALGQHEDAVIALREAVDIRRQLAEADTSFKPDFASSLLNLSVVEASLRQDQHAFASAQEATFAYGDLYAVDAQQYGPSLIVALNGFANRHFTLNRSQRALQLVDAAIELGTQLTWNPGHRDEINPDIAMSLHTRALILYDLGDAEGSVQATNQALDLQRSLALQHRVFEPALANTLLLRSLACLALHDHNAALASAEEALRTITPHFKGNPVGFANWTESIVRQMRRLEQLGSTIDTSLVAELDLLLQTSAMSLQ